MPIMSLDLDAATFDPLAMPSIGGLKRVENAILAAVLGALCLVPVAELFLRATFHTGIFAAASIVQHLGLAVGMLGGAMAAREGRLLTMSALSMALPERLRRIASVFANGLATAVCVILVAAGVDFVAAERASPVALAYGVTLWWVQALIPAGFALVGWRLLQQTVANAWARALGAAVCGALVALTPGLPVITPTLFTGAMAVLLVGAVFGTPLFAVLAGSAALLFWHDGLPMAALAVDHYRTVVNPTLPAIPLFTLAGYLLAESGAPRRLIEVFEALFGRLRGGAAIVTVLACTFFTSFTGASGATVLALGGLLMPLLLNAGYAQRSALGLVTAAGLPGTLLMPALPLILYAVVASVNIKEMFLGGMLPTALMAGAIAVWGIRRQGPRPAAVGAFDLRRIRVALAQAKWELSVPLIPMLSMATGIATPVESAALTALYVFIVTTVIHRDLSLRHDAPRVITECGLIVGGILLVMGVALGLTDYLVDAQIPDQVVSWVSGAFTERVGFLFALNVSLLVAGCLIEIYPAILILAPIVMKLGEAFGIHPVHLGIIFLANMELGYLTPLVGLNLFFASYRFGKPVAEIFRAVLPLFFVLAAGVLVITYVPWISLALPGLLR
jgi:C4-dicarboxylate transporter DctM subunit